MKNDSRPVFIVGAPRSGTTLLQYMLRSHPNLSLPTGESHFFIPLFTHAERWGDLAQAGQVKALLAEMYRRSAEFLDTDLHGLRFDIDSLSDEIVTQGLVTVPDIIDFIYTKNAKGEGKQRWGDKTPYYVFHMPTILQMFPGAQFVHLIRDGRDCALSLIDRKDDFGVYNLHFAGRYWKEYVDRGRESGAQLPDGSYLEVKYEELISQPKLSVAKILAFLGEQYHTDVIEFRKSSLAPEESKTPLLSRSIDAANKEKWRLKMSPWGIRLFESAAGRTLTASGYALETSEHELPLPIRACYRLHNQAVRRLRRYWRAWQTRAL
ncbi:sulfotransferase family protein [Aestuariirhabdus litorea]|uniref:Sulfotransferase n=1 Tax=Aestuariirhabdus litorea TaxID=2528527 RepID=A0A3P3VQD5_9GAMM|nr:sulfotransferase [Aestuariirhabdus litorea]RRJ84537.1 sulfotransferase [Aestuariirhabdus litorea]RWW97763.1 sulfotransferase [Endozoicomonadaceae bacterium GTF-13]